MNPVLDDLLAFAKGVLQGVLALFLMACGTAWFVYELQQPTVHAWHLGGAAFIVVFGANALPWIGPAVSAALKNTVGAFGQVAATVVQVLTRQQPPSDPKP